MKTIALAPGDLGATCRTSLTNLVCSSLFGYCFLLDHGSVVTIVIALEGIDIHRTKLCLMEGDLR